MKNCPRKGADMLDFVGGKVIVLKKNHPWNQADLLIFESGGVVEICKGGCKQPLSLEMSDGWVRVSVCGGVQRAPISAAKVRFSPIPDHFGQTRNLTDGSVQPKFANPEQDHKSGSEYGPVLVQQALNSGPNWFYFKKANLQVKQLIYKG